jgi:hypothetical protein
MLDDPQRNLDHTAESKLRQRFAEQSEFFWNQLSERCEEAQPIAAIGILNPSNEGDLLIFGYGSLYEQTKLLATVLKQLKAKMMAELDA